MKFKLVNFAGDIFNQLLQPKFSQLMAENFNIETFDNQITYDKSSTVFCISLYQFNANETKDTIKNLIDAGYKIIIENLHEGGFGLESHLIPQGNNVLTITCGTKGQSKVHVPMFFWYNMYPAYVDSVHRLNYTTLNRVYKFDKKFLMLMNNIRPFRDNIYNKFNDILADSYHSYVERGIKISDDDNTLPIPEWMRYINVDWYNCTQFSVVVETTMNSNGVFLTEKTMKPLAIKHPFITLGDTGSLALLKSSGFETFENIFDESYDNITSQLSKIDAVYTQVKNYNQTGYSKLTEDKLEHNYNLFHNDAEVNRRFKLEIIEPILEFANATP